MASCLNRREFLHDSARALLSLGTGVAALSGVRTAMASQPTAAAPLKICLVSGSDEYRSSESLSAYQEYLEGHYPVACSRAFGQEKTDNLPGLEALETCDVMLLFTRRMTVSGEQLERVKNYCRAGKPIVGLRTASHAFQNWLEFDREVQGGNYLGHYGAGPITEVKFEEKAKNHPLLAGVKPFTSVASLYKNTGLAADVEVLATGTIPDHTEPLAWTRRHNGGRVFYCSLGHPEDFKTEHFVRLLTNALFWVAKRKTEKKAG